MKIDLFPFEILKGISQMTFLRLQKRIVGESETLQKEDFFWALNTLCEIKKISVHEFLSVSELIAPYTTDLLIHAAKLVGLRVLKVHRPSCRISAKTLPSLALSSIQFINKECESDCQLRIDLIVGCGGGKITYMPANENRLITVRCDDYAKRYTENLLLII
jgi:hypothetical protein